MFGLRRMREFGFLFFFLVFWWFGWLVEALRGVVLLTIWLPAGWLRSLWPIIWAGLPSEWPKFGKFVRPDLNVRK